MDTLFPLEPVWPEGFHYIPDFISPDEEKELVQLCEQTAVTPFEFLGYTALRQTASFGKDWSFTRKELLTGKPIPPQFFPLIQKVADNLNRAALDFAELLVTAYPPGSVINWHRDAPPFDLIAGISLLTDATFKLRPHEAEKRSRKAIVSLPVKPRSLYIMEGAARSAWQHSIAPVKRLRYSITLRTLKNG